MRSRWMFFAAAVFALFSTSIAYAQDIEALRKQYPNEKAVFLNKVLEYNITLRDGAPLVQSHETEQIAFLNDKANAFMGSYGFSHSDFQQLISYEAHTRTQNKKVLKVNDFKTSTNQQDFVFYDDVKYTTFNFPSVEPGAVGRLDVSWHNKNPYLLSPYYFTSYLPVVNSQLKLTVSADIVLKYLKVGLDTANIVVSVEKGRRNNIYTFTYSHCPSDKRYPDAPGYAWYSPHVVFCIEKYKNKSGQMVSYLSDTDDLYRLNYSFLKEVNNSADADLKRVTDSVTAGAASTEEKARRIYSWVQHHIKYVAFEDGMGGFVPRNASLVCMRRFGDCKDMSSILTQMMTLAGVKAHFTWIGTRSLPYKYSEIALPLVSNHMICTIELDNKFVFLDGTDATCVFGTPSQAIQDKEAMIAINEKEYKIINVPAISKEQNAIADTTWLEVTPAGLKGHIKQNLTGYFATEVYAKLMYWGQKDIHNRMKAEFVRGSNKFQLDTFFIDRKAITNAITLTGNFTLPDYAKKIGDEYYLNLNLFRFYQNEEIDYPARKSPVEHDFKFIKKYVTIINLPAGYKVTYLPQNKSFRNDIWGFTISYRQNGNQVILTQEYDNNDLMLTSNRFQAWNKVLENLLPLYKETLSFSKI